MNREQAFLCFQQMGWLKTQQDMGSVVVMVMLPLYCWLEDVDAARRFFLLVVRRRLRPYPPLDDPSPPYPPLPPELLPDLADALE